MKKTTVESEAALRRYKDAYLNYLMSPATEPTPNSRDYGVSSRQARKVRREFGSPLALSGR